jgi:acetyltransferase
VPAAIIISAGLPGMRPKGAELEQRCLAEARRVKMRLLGPNCLGAMVPHHRFNATFAEGLAKPGSVAFLRQSGALCSAVARLEFSRKRRL